MSTKQEGGTQTPSRAEPHFEAGTVKKDSYSSVSATPWVAFVLAISSTLCIIGSALVIQFSNGKVVGAWIPASPSIQPSVLLSIFATIFRTCQSLSLSYGVAILWWRTALAGTTLKNLHYLWNKGDWASVDGLRRAWASSRQTKRLMVVFGIISITNIAEGPLLQRSTRPEIAVLETPYREHWSLPEAIPDGWAGTVEATAPAALFSTASLAQTLQIWHSGANVYPIAPDCRKGQCSGDVVGPGITFNCSSALRYVDLTSLGNSTATAFDLRFNRTLDKWKLPALEMELQFVSEVDSQCNATVAMQTCAIRMARVNYSVQINDGAAFLASGTPSVVEEFSSVGDLEDARDGLPAGGLAALDYLAYYYLQSNATLGHNATENSYWADPGYGSLSLKYEDTIFSETFADCAFQWVNATDDILQSLHNATFHMALAVSDGTETSNPKTWTKFTATQVYRSDFRVFWVVFSFMVLSLGCSLSLLWGYSDLTREVTLSPLETGAALGRSPLSADDLEDMDVKKLIEVMGDTMVRWHPKSEGAEEPGTESTRLTTER